MKRLRFRLAISAAELQYYYAGQVSALTVMTEQGLRLQLPLHHLRRFVSHGGLNGRFEVVLNDHNALQQLERI
ncbi:DUF2835 domain-containing protein [Oceanimonas baumannii]|uniref:Uncharacterized protein DUF2835 n=1 Tax=Oceanimonas baumannii TaxID=129578 RepID=A0A235C9G6_9GAMM|nr:DUF2835 domain-containing protein [Oceanimonas baumannii]MCC4264248.1 DUF2835 domain-containing protein [Oceanimonas baumannii]OYD21223.1 hypothetical protein B6S09_16990 [Oceanimonas baumannii]TDW55276.1 uncharacterized protein DUF2835 [Oceanimonas baumannii]